MAYNDMLQEIYLYGCNNDDDAVLEVIRHNLRCVFDPYCAEWNWTDEKSKLHFINLIKASTFSFTLQELISAFKGAFEKSGRPDIASAADDAISEYYYPKGTFDELRSRI
jgi:hypothetical protein